MDDNNFILYSLKLTDEDLEYISGEDLSEADLKYIEESKGSFFSG